MGIGANQNANNQYLYMGLLGVGTVAGVAYFNRHAEPEHGGDHKLTDIFLGKHGIADEIHSGKNVVEKNKNAVRHLRAHGIEESLEGEVKATTKALLRRIK